MDRPAVATLGAPAQQVPPAAVALVDEEELPVEEEVAEHGVCQRLPSCVVQFARTPLTIHGQAVQHYQVVVVAWLSRVAVAQKKLECNHTE